MTSAFLPKHKKLSPNYEGYKVIGAGLPRTGTMSTQAALEKILNGPCYHMLTMWEGGDEEVDHWEKMLDGKLSDEDWKWFLQGRGFRSGVDYPISHHFETLMRVFPDAKVLLTVRDPERWYESVKSTIYKNRHRLSGNTGLFLKIVGRYRMAQTAVMCSNQGYPITKMGLFDAIACGKEASIKFYNDWLDHVKKTVPADRLLIFEVKQGWKPLCNFLELPEPKESFPHVNDSVERNRLEKKLHLASNTVIYGLPVFVILLISIFLSMIF